MGWDDGFSGVATVFFVFHPSLSSLSSHLDKRVALFVQVGEDAVLVGQAAVRRFAFGGGGRRKRAGRAVCGVTKKKKTG
jgi:hypothetical protein